MSKYPVSGCAIVKHAVVYGLDEAVRRSKYPMVIDTEACDAMATGRTAALGNAPMGSGHDNFLCGIVAQFDLTMTVKAWTEAERYHFFEIISSQSTMHRLSKFDLDTAYSPYTDPRVVAVMKELAARYNETKDPEDYLRCLYSNPCGFRLTAGMTTNYRQLKTIYYQRKNHRLPEWRMFCQWIETLPMFSQLCLGGKEEEHE